MTRREAEASAYGAATSLVLLLIWVYYSAQILFLGAQFAQTLQYGARIPVAPTVSAVPRITHPNFSNIAGAFGLGLVLGAFALRPPGGRRDAGLGILHKLYTHLTALR